MNPHPYLIPAAIISLALSFDTIDTIDITTIDTTTRMVNLGVHTAATYAGERSEPAGERSESLACTTDPYHGMTDTERMAGVVLEPMP